MSRPYDVDNKQVICKAGAIGFETLGFEPALPACGARVRRFDLAVSACPLRDRSGRSLTATAPMFRFDAPFFIGRRFKFQVGINAAPLGLMESARPLKSVNRRYWFTMVKLSSLEQSVDFKLE